MSVKDTFDQFKLYVAGLEYSPDTIALDNALGVASNMLYDIRLQIDIEWAAQRAKVKRPPSVQELGFLDKFSDDELAAALAAVRGHKRETDNG